MASRGIRKKNSRLDWMNTKHREGKAKGDIQLTVEIHEFELCESTHIQIFFFLSNDLCSSNPYYSGVTSKIGNSRLQRANHSYKWIISRNMNCWLHGRWLALTASVVEEIYINIHTHTRIYIYTHTYISQNELRSYHFKTYEKILTNAFKKSILRIWI